MQRKLKAVFRSSSKHRATEQADHDSAATSPRSARVDRRATSLEERSRPRTSGSSQGGTPHSSRSRPLSSAYDSRRVSNAPGPQSVAADFSQSRSSEPPNESIANDYRAYLPVLSPVYDSYDDPHMTLGADRRLRTGESDGRHEEDVADRNIERYRTSLDVSKRKPLPATPGTVAGTEGQHDIERQIEQMLDGVVDLRNTVDEDKEVQWAPAVTHEVLKPHEHEVIQHKIYREIHNYDYYYYTQPVYDIQVLPPRHWIPNPDGEGLIEISADELPSRTGANRRWKIVHEEIEQPAETRPSWRTEPEIIEHPTTITEEGFERKETTIIYPPTLQDMTDYDGLVQPVHFDHKTGKRWLGQVTTMHQLRQELGQVVDPESMDMKELAENLPQVPEVNDHPKLTKSAPVTRKPVSGPVPARLGQLGEHTGVAF